MELTSMLCSENNMKMELVSASDLDLFKSPARIILSGFSSSGKTHFASLLIAKYLNKFSRVIICGISQFENKFLSNENKITFIDGEVYDPFSDCDLLPNTLIVIDDLIASREYLNIAANIFSKGRHQSISCIFITQNLFLCDKKYRTISLNASHFLLFKMRDLNQIRHFSKTFLNKEKSQYFLAIYRKYVLNSKYGYLLIDFNQSHDSPLMIRTNILNEYKEMCFTL